ncbi:hypothetical protein [uncultured Dubosiella sp.]|uniref:hypothetical protein n=1 Tax=uncultured Dubosiella sp. TaxID=1937011 RepID=UPI00258FC07F|nr:hypothetical protein [uncultured Dubosiella sp.]
MMKKIKHFLAKPIVTVLLLVMAVGLLLGSGVQGTRAALNYYSDTYQSRLSLTQIGVSLVENDCVVASRDYKENGEWTGDESSSLLKSIVEMKDFKIGQRYPEVLAVKNTGQINEFVRVTLVKYWIDEDGNKIQDVSPDLIDFSIVENGQWIKDETASTSERNVYYYKNLLEAGETSAPLTDGFKIDRKLHEHKKVEVTEEDGKVITTTSYTYDGIEFCVEAKVDAIQEHNADEAIKSAWGKDVHVRGTTLTLQ